MESLLATSTALLAGLLMTRVFKLIHLHLPDVTAFLLAGLLVGFLADLPVLALRRL